MLNSIKNFFTKSKNNQNNSNSNNFDDSSNNNNAYFQQQIPKKSHEHDTDVRLIKPIQKDKKVVAVIVTFVSDTSYDHLFTSV
jgi:hypothetical protein